MNLNRFRQIIEKRKFDEYDIIVFLITIRAHLEKTRTPFIYDFADGIAHRDRDQGYAFNSIMNAEKSNYVLNKFGRVRNYDGIVYEIWKNEWINISKLFNIKITPIIISEITLCIFSIFQFTKFKHNQKQIEDNHELQKFKGTFELLIDKNLNLNLSTIGKKAVCYGRLSDIVVEDKHRNTFFFDPVETVRINKRLYLQCNGERILYVKKVKTIIKNI